MTFFLSGTVPTNSAMPTLRNSKINFDDTDGLQIKTKGKKNVHGAEILSKTDSKRIRMTAKGGEQRIHKLSVCHPIK